MEYVFYECAVVSLGAVLVDNLCWFINYKWKLLGLPFPLGKHRSAIFVLVLLLLSTAHFCSIMSLPQVLDSLPSFILLYVLVIFSFIYYIFLVVRKIGYFSLALGAGPYRVWAGGGWVELLFSPFSPFPGEGGLAWKRGGWVESLLSLSFLWRVDPSLLERVGC